MGKSIPVDFTLKPHNYIPMVSNNSAIPTKQNAKYLEMYIDANLKWKTHLQKKKKKLNLQFQSMSWLLKDYFISQS